MTKLTSSMMVLKVTMMIVAMRLTPLALFIMKITNDVVLTLKMISINDDDDVDNVRSQFSRS